MIPSSRPEHPSKIHPSDLQGASNTYTLEQRECEREEGFWVEDEEGHEGFMATEHEGAFWILEENDAWAECEIRKKKRQRNTGLAFDSTGHHRPQSAFLFAHRPMFCFAGKRGQCKAIVCETASRELSKDAWFCVAWQ